MMTRQQGMGWWREKWIEPFVASLVDEIERQGSGTDLALALCARLDDGDEPTRIIGGLQARGVNHLRVRFD